MLQLDIQTLTIAGTLLVMIAGYLFGTSNTGKVLGLLVSRLRGYEPKVVYCGTGFGGQFCEVMDSRGLYITFNSYPESILGLTFALGSAENAVYRR